MSERNLSGSIALTKLTHVMMEKKGKTGMIKGIFIPIELNALETKDDAVYLPIRVTAKDETDSYRQNGFISKSVKRAKKWSEMTEAEKEAEKALTPILGNLKDFSMVGGNDAAGAASGPVGEDDDLPF
ncbi:hypothetical protein [Pedobacter punctiformis]|uniref:Uncharacterized protein n=1 Tax=Pedobacter punctiformis TaxID=3004097 RepID=A0ABT4LAJ2_9SPHI|nr:hypothetical protein [Pedobacter sp. HCMS5-2]MCZ4244933.1 hypothetical protein [Pedobacter sp. HCMS5-2]